VRGTKPEKQRFGRDTWSAVNGLADDLAPGLRELSLAIHARPETGYEEHYAVGQLAERLEELGFAVARDLGDLPTAFKATYEFGDGGPTIALIAEYDALPEIGHGCGHNLICAAAVGAAAIVKEVLSGAGVQGRVTVIGTPAEEGGGGKVLLLERGAFDGVDAAMMFHAGHRTMTVRGSLAATRVTMRFHGKAAHAASRPHLGVNALDACIQTFNAVNALRQHVKDETRVHGVITHGGTVPNIVPEYAEARFIIRHRKHQYMLEVAERVFAAARHAAASVGATVELEQGLTYAERKVNHVMAERFGSYLEALGERVLPPEPTGGVGSSDFGNLSQAVPAIHPYIAIVPDGVSAHTREFAEAAASTSGLRALDLATRCLAQTTIDLLTEPGLLAAAKAEFAAGDGA
jgi:amidohydrolase